MQTELYLRDLGTCLQEGSLALAFRAAQGSGLVASWSFSLLFCNCSGMSHANDDKCSRISFLAISPYAIVSLLGGDSHC